MTIGLRERQPVQVLARVTGLLIGCLIVIVLLFSLQSWRDKKAQAVEDLFNILELESHTIDGFFTHLQNEMRIFAGDLGDLGTADALARGFLLIQRFKELRPEFTNISITGADGQVLFTAKDPPAPGLPTLAKEPSFLHFKEESNKGRNLVIGRPMVAVLAKEWTIPVRYQLLDDDGRIRHVICACLSLTFLQEFYKDAPFTRKASLGLMRDDGFLVSRYPVPNQLDLGAVYGQPRSGKLITHLQERNFPRQGYVEGPSSLDGPDYLTCYLRLEHFPLTLFIAMPEADIHADWWSKVRMSYTLMFFLSAAGIAFYFFTLKQQRAREKEQLAAAMALKESEFFTKNIIDGLPSHVAVIDEAGTILLVNEAWKAFAKDNGCSDESFHRGENYLAVCEKAAAREPDSSADKALAGIRAVMAGSLPFFSFEYPCHAPDARRWFLMRVLRLDGAKSLLLIVHDNITERILAEEAVRKSGELYRSMFEKNNAIKLLIDTEGSMIVDANQAACKFYGYHREQLLGMRLTEINVISPQQAPGELAKAESEEGGYLRRRHRLASGDIRDVEVHSGPLEIEGRTLLYSIIHDITDRLRAERALEESKRQYDEMVARVPVGIYRLRMTPAGFTSFEYVSPKWCELMHLSESEVRADARVAYARIHPDDLPGLIAANEAAKIQLGKLAWQGRFIIDGQVRFMQIESTPRKFADGDIVWTGMVGDITLRKHAEEQQQQLQKAESLARMAGAVAHHFNNKLMAIMTGLDLALEDLDHNDQAAENIKESLKAAEQAAEVSSLMLNCLGQGKLALEALDLGEICQEVASIQTRLLPDNIQLAVQQPPRKLTILANRGKLLQAVTSIFNNAREAIGDRPGKIRLSTAIFNSRDLDSFTLHPRDWQPEKDSYACLEISDNGCGIDRKALNLIFDPFFSTKFTGRGLGLAVTMGTVRSHGGAMSVESEVGRGTVFRIFLPLEEIQAGGETLLLPAADVPRVTPTAVLVVDDDPQVVGVVKSMLTRMGQAVISAGNGFEAVKIFGERRDEIELVLLDLTMAGKDGWQTLAELRQMAPHLPVILASGYDHIDTGSDTHQELPQAVLHKPYNRRELERAIETALGNRR